MYGREHLEHCERAALVSAIKRAIESFPDLGVEVEVRDGEKVVTMRKGWRETVDAPQGGPLRDAYERQAEQINAANPMPMRALGIGHLNSGYFAGLLGLK